MPRLSIFKPEKGNDYKFFDRNIKEMFTVGGTDLHFHKYLGPYDQGDTNKDGVASPTNPQYSGDSLNERTIQDLLFHQVVCMCSDLSLILRKHKILQQRLMISV